MLEMNKMMDIDKAARYLGVSRSWLYKLTSNRLITHYKPGGKKLYFFQSDLDDYLLKNRIPASDGMVEKCNADENLKAS